MAVLGSCCSGARIFLRIYIALKRERGTEWKVREYTNLHLALGKFRDGWKYGLGQGCKSLWQRLQWSAICRNPFPQSVSQLQSETPCENVVLRYFLRIPVFWNMLDYVICMMEATQGVCQHCLHFDGVERRKEEWRRMERKNGIRRG